MNNQFLETIKDEEFIGIIPISPIGLDMKFAKKKLTPGFLQIIVMFVISLPITVPLMAIIMFSVSSLLRQMAGANIIETVVLLILSLFLLACIALPTYLVYQIYVRKIKKYPVTLFVLTKEDFHFFILNDNEIDLHHKFDITYDKLGEVFYGQIDKKTKALAKRFQIRKNGAILLKGNLKLAKDKFTKNNIDEDLLLPIDKLKSIYLS